VKIKIFDSPDELAISFCEHLKKLSEEKVKLTIALSGGSTPLKVFSLLAVKYSTLIDWNKIHFFWGDERMVPPEHPESNYGSAKSVLFNHINIFETNIHRIEGENNPLDEAERYSGEIEKYVTFSDHLPKFDLMMLGLGDDVHTASIFPDQMYLLKSERICAVAVHPASKQKRVTLTGNVINNSAEIFFIVSGRSKQKIVFEILEQKNNSKYPAANINPASGELNFYMDAEAALLIQQKVRRM
jgi:6-phosphogluconolactonase